MSGSRINSTASQIRPAPPGKAPTAASLCASGNRIRPDW